ncbi:hypothetical protein KCP71_12130 [Salmonella enterica subsp. enterica]|nr:hypothetical protein KCP71_12130 [Salmonella enterica subsp. enterica]
MPATTSGPTPALHEQVSSIPLISKTRVKLSDGMPVPVNTLTFDGKPASRFVPKIRRMRWKRI